MTHSDIFKSRSLILQITKRVLHIKLIINFNLLIPCLLNNTCKPNFKLRTIVNVIYNTDMQYLIFSLRRSLIQFIFYLFIIYKKFAVSHFLLHFLFKLLNNSVKEHQIIFQFDYDCVYFHFLFSVIDFNIFFLAHHLKLSAAFFQFSMYVQPAKILSVS